MQVSIHAPNEGSDEMAEAGDVGIELFQSTLPMKGATWKQMFNTWLLEQLFQSTLPMKGATRLRSGRRGEQMFQSTLPMKGATTQSRFSPRATCFNPRSQ